MPATRPALVDDLLRQGAHGVLSSVVCLEDAVADRDLVAAEANVVAQLARAASEDGLDERLPLTFVRVRHPDQVALVRSEEHTSELQSRHISYAVFCLKKIK